MKIKASSYFLIFLLIVVAVVIVASLGMPYYESKLLPLIVGGITFVLLAVELWRELHPKDKEAPLTQAEEAADKELFRRTAIAIAWVLGATLGVYLLGFIAAITLFILAYLKKQGRSWQVSLAVAVITSTLIYGIFQFTLGFELYGGIIYNTITR